jgi:hypothetical protein
VVTPGREARVNGAKPCFRDRVGASLSKGPEQRRRFQRSRKAEGEIYLADRRRAEARIAWLAERRQRSAEAAPRPQTVGGEWVAGGPEPAQAAGAPSSTALIFRAKAALSESPVASSI